MGSLPRPVFVVVLLLLSVGVATGEQADTSSDEGQLLDVRVFSLECLTTHPVNQQNPSHRRIL